MLHRIQMSRWMSIASAGSSMVKKSTSFYSQKKQNAEWNKSISMCICVYFSNTILQWLRLNARRHAMFGGKCEQQFAIAPFFSSSVLHNIIRRDKNNDKRNRIDFCCFCFAFCRMQNAILCGCLTSQHFILFSNFLLRVFFSRFTFAIQFAAYFILLVIAVGCYIHFFSTLYMVTVSIALKNGMAKDAAVVDRSKRTEKNRRKRPKTKKGAKTVCYLLWRAEK